VITVTTNLELGTADIAVLAVLAILLVIAVKIVIGFFKKEKK
jgi:hypothetical protein